MSIEQEQNESAENDLNWFEKNFLSSLNKAMNKSLSYDLVSVKKLDAFNKKVIKVELLSTPFTFYIKIKDREITLAKHHQADVNTTIKGTPIALFAMSSDEPIEGVGNVEINGDANTGQFFAKWLKNLNPDWEEAWCDLLGDGMGVRVSKTVHGVLNFAKDLKNTLIRNTQEYLVEESRDLVSPTEMEQFLDDVDDLKSDTARLEQQINNLKSK